MPAKTILITFQKTSCSPCPHPSLCSWSHSLVVVSMTCEEQLGAYMLFVIVFLVLVIFVMNCVKIKLV
ncbi:hypothetical protein GQ55_8G105600 [Panicum hallii var. hallii]|uniref:Uncharacterized protein n=1 Tax=Panicum hallii var. hallii TaxID=1504633 RepID=A0A2T7CMF5_9POAL|nr:hypothetical protein GQ55_8G105600 [Panicum hallii var. hallii]